MLFMVEGFPSIIVAVFAWCYMHDSCVTAVYLNRREKRIARSRLRKEKDLRDRGGARRGLTWKEIGETLVDPKS